MTELFVYTKYILNFVTACYRLPYLASRSKYMSVSQAYNCKMGQEVYRGKHNSKLHKTQDKQIPDIDFTIKILMNSYI